ncbi:cytochrome P450 [Longispora sp. NPDC051575]|uniref:cytochrome P450 family protein n=1 Tax=Longispora sp. NPDC051575 TaxID=3154943 RepID=UPI0034127D9B
MQTAPVALDAAFVRDPYPVYDRLRALGPVHPAVLPDGQRVWLVVGHEEVRAALADPRLSVDKRHAAPGGWKGLQLPPALDANLLNLDGPDHARLRRLVAGAFTARRVAGLRPGIEATAGALLDAMARRTTADLVADYAAPLPVAVIGDLLGVAPDDRGDFKGWTDTMLAAEAGERVDARSALGELLAFLTLLIATKRGKPADDLLSDLIAARDGDGGRLSEDELLSMAFLLLFAGHETSVQLIGTGAVALIREPALRGAPDLVEELLRHDGPVGLAVRRFPTEDLVLGGTLVPAGDAVLLSLGAAHRDPARYADPDVLRPGRPDQGHLGFGHGVHYCLGAPLARLEAEIALAALFARFPDVALAVPADQLHNRPTFRVRGLAAVPVRLNP